VPVAAIARGMHRVESEDQRSAAEAGVSLGKFTDLVAGTVFAAPEIASFRVNDDTSYECTVIWSMQKSDQRREREHKRRYG
jgi:hypothetical protein